MMMAMTAEKIGRLMKKRENIEQPYFAVPDLDDAVPAAPAFAGGSPVPCAGALPAPGAVGEPGVGAPARGAVPAAGGVAPVAAPACAGACAGAAGAPAAICTGAPGRTFSRLSTIT